MSINVTPFFMWSDTTTDRIPQQNLDASGAGFVLQAGVNTRTVFNQATGLNQVVGDKTVNSRGSKNIVWSSEAYTSLGNPVPALTVAQKKATGLHTANAGVGALDLSAYRNLTLVVNLASFTAGTSPTIQFEFDEVDDTGTPVVFATWKPTALSAAAATKLSIGPGVAFPQAAAAPTLPATGFGAIAVPSGWTYYAIPLTFLPNGQIQWTVTGAPTAIAWSAWLYGMN